MSEQNNNKKKASRTKAVAAIAVLVIIAIILCLKACTADKTDESPSGGVSLGVIDLNDEENQNIDLEGMANAIADESMFQVFINSEMVVASNGQVDFRIQNTKDNFHPCYVEIV